jgi:hypothetical protein
MKLGGATSTLLGVAGSVRGAVYDGCVCVCVCMCVRRCGRVKASSSGKLCA